LLSHPHTLWALYLRSSCSKQTVGMRFPLILVPLLLASVQGKDKDASEVKASSLLEQMQFSGPFQTHDHRGSRILPYFDKGGEALVKNNFVRLTPETPGSRGHVWTSRYTLGSSTFSSELKFRISGSKERQGGESLAMFITDQRRPVPGDVYGLDSKFTGVAIVVDTQHHMLSPRPSVQRDPSVKHRDVTILANNGTRTTAEMMAEMVGCNANLRYWEGRDDFNVLKASRVRIKYAESTLTVELDARNTGRWRRCATLNDLDLPEGWAEKATLGLLALNSETAANNNDVLSLRTFTDPEGAWNLEAYENDDDDYDHLIHHMEHEMFNVQKSLRSTIELLEQAEEESERRITALEAKLSSEISEALESRIATLEGTVKASMHYSLNEKIGRVEEGMEAKLLETVDEGINRIAGAWRTPFLLLVGAVGAVLIMSYFKYKELRKEHLL
ncbi:unnamed protein product, partial [Chrysoparadoxa australica]